MLYMNLGFKYKLLLAIALTFVGLASLSLLSVVSLNKLNQVSDQVGQLSQQQSLLNQLRLAVLQQAINVKSGQAIAAESDQAGSLALLLEKFTPLLKVRNSRVEQFPEGDYGALLAKLQHWVEVRHQWLDMRRQFDQELRQDVQASVVMFDKAVFSTFRQPFDHFAKSVAQLLEIQNEVSAQKVRENLTLLKQAFTKLSFNDFYEEQLSHTESRLTKVIQHLAQMQQLDQSALDARLSLIRLAESRSGLLDQALRNARVESQATGDKVLRQIVIVGFLVAILVLGLLLITWRQATQSLKQTVAVLDVISQGDLTPVMAVNKTRDDEFDRVGLAVNHLTDRFSQLLSQVISGGQTVQQMSQELRNIIDQLAQSNEQTGQQAQTAATAVEQISLTLLEMTGATGEAHQQALQASATADDGGEVIAEALESLDGLGLVFTQLSQNISALEEASSRVDGVTDMINSLAEQTNLLALNAAIEAARAGDAGRGFSVVADEVRALAEKTVQATSDINSIVSNMKQQLQVLMQIMSSGEDNVANSRVLGDRAMGEIELIKARVLQVSACNNQLTSSIEQVSQATQSISSNMAIVANNAKQDVILSHNVLALSDQVSEQNEKQSEMSQRFKCHDKYA